MNLTVRNITLCFLFWTGVFLLTIASHFFTAMFRDNLFDWREAVPFAADWYLWFFLTFPVVYFVRRFPIMPPHKRILWRHVGIFLVTNLVQIILSSLLIKALLSWLNHDIYRNILTKTAISGTFYNLIIYGAILVIVNSFINYKALQQEKDKSLELEKQLAVSRINFLKQQLQPHFLFNTHHSIITLMKIGEKNKAIQMMEKLSDLMRFALRENNAQEIILEKEVALLELYLDIQKVRFGEKLTVILDVPKNLRTAYVPSMILQPIVENSIKYAVEKSSTGSTLFIKASKKMDQLVLTVKDKVEEQVQKTIIQKGIGLNNTEERLEKLYANQHHMGIQFYTENGYHGLQITIQIPLRYA